MASTRTILSGEEAISPNTDIVTAEYTPDPHGPGGRHDNDFADIRKIAILPTSDELASSGSDPFLSLASEIEPSLRLPDGLTFHVDRQFRLLREDKNSHSKRKYFVGRKESRYSCRTIS